MSGNSDCKVYVGDYFIPRACASSKSQCNLDERVSDRVFYDILIQAGQVVDSCIPRDKESDKPNGFAFAEYESAEVASYTIQLFSGLASLYNRTLDYIAHHCTP